MNLDPLLQPAGPHLHTLIAPHAAAYDALRGLETRGATVRVIRGSKSTTTHAFFNELAAALQFPFYFGDNWDACNDCLNDLTWLPEHATAGVIVFSNAPALLEAATPADCKILIDLFTRSTAPGPARKTTGNPRPVHLVFQAAPADAALLSKRWPGIAPLP